MARSSSSGLPKGFDIGATKDDLGPVQLGDYLEESLRPAPMAPPRPQRTLPLDRDEEREPIPLSIPQESERPRRISSFDEVPNDDGPSGGRRSALLRPAKQARLQINLSVEGTKAHEDLVAYIQSRSRQRDVKHAEIYQALAMALSEALPYLDLKNVPERGAWGSPTARSFIVALKAAFVRAVGELYTTEHRQ